MVTGSGTSLTVVDFVDLGAMLGPDGTASLLSPYAHGDSAYTCLQPGNKPGKGAFATYNTDVNALAQTLQTDYLLR
jgi:hypothetical protein